jgi:hypothetical protein
MYSVKPGRGPSAMGVGGAIFVGLFGILWTISAASMGAPIMFVFFGIGFTFLAVATGIMSLYNATASNRFSTIDIVPTATEPDPFNHLVTRNSGRSKGQPPNRPDGFCPYCGSSRFQEFKFCPKCGKALDASE